jgi:hypothetical protein
LTPAGDVATCGNAEVAGADRGENGGRGGGPSCAQTHIEPFFLDRSPVTNRQYREFVAAGGYREMGIWETRVWPAVLEMVDQTGVPGPRFWKNGSCRPGEEDLPVVGICWYEAAACAAWMGKRLPTDAEWLAAAARGDCRLGEEVGEWTNGRFSGDSAAGVATTGESLDSRSSRRSAGRSGGGRSGSGENPFSRRHHLGFRCVVGQADVVLAPPLAQAESHAGEEAHDPEAVLV